MCGIFGMLSLKGDPLHYPHLAETMGRVLHHRGPDSHKVFARPDFILGSQRLRINDLSPRADQPFTDPSGSAVLVCNGEIYNAPELRARYGDYPFHTASDVEPLIPLLTSRGMEGLAEVDGMFGLALYDSTRRSLLLARDRAGEKPLFYAILRDELWFASEVAALLIHPDLPRHADAAALRDYLILGYARQPRTMFASIRQIEAGTALSFAGTSVTPYRYWYPGAIKEVHRDDHSAAEELKSMLEGAVARQIVADVPVGVFLSGGLDSSILTTLVARNTDPSRINTFAARFAHDSFDESGHAERVARSMGVNHHSVPVGTTELLDAFEEVTRSCAEPISDPAILPTYILSKTAKKTVRVVLTGEGADELFGGYPTYIGHQAARHFNRLPSPVRSLIRAAVLKIPGSHKKVTFEFLLKSFVESAGRSLPQRHLYWVGTRLDVPGGDQIDWPGPHDAAPAQQAMHFDYQAYLPDNLLRKLDRATMLHSIESRAPFLDHALTRFALSLEEPMKVRGITTKWLLKKAASDWLPHSIVYRKKRGLSVPVASFLNDELRREVDLLLSDDFQEFHQLGRPLLRRMILEHGTGSVNHVRSLWPLIVLRRWVTRWKVQPPLATLTPQNSSQSLQPALLEN
ncbi:MAG TPA: asparagine synthase (glutamine-hydrolyzing) [Thermoanaerobaculia bacterium]|nr:asparagine synthase (glutamine-hydrolyzing) [Thermoanaerobaculia bacterium]